MRALAAAMDTQELIPDSCPNAPLGLSSGSFLVPYRTLALRGRLAWHVRLRVGSAQRGLEETHCCEIALLALLDSMASLVVDAAYVHHGTAAAAADNINGWSEAALKRIKPKAFKRRLESALGLSIERACWCAARDGRVDAVATKLDKRLRKAGFVTSYRRIKMDEVVCRNRDCVAAGTCPHLHRSNPVRCRRQAGVDVDVHESSWNDAGLAWRIWGAARVLAHAVDASRRREKKTQTAGWSTRAGGACSSSAPGAGCAASPPPRAARGRWC